MSHQRKERDIFMQYVRLVCENILIQTDTVAASVRLAVATCFSL